jgi:hypothetical protein
MEVLLDLQEKQRDEEIKKRRNIISFLEVFTFTKLDSKIFPFDNVRRMDLFIGQFDGQILQTTMRKDLVNRRNLQ